MRTSIPSPLGTLYLTASILGLESVTWTRPTDRFTIDNSRVTKEFTHQQIHSPDHLLRLAEVQLKEYFLGRRTYFQIPLAPLGTPFQIQVWQALRKIPYGKVRSYKDIALAIGNPGAMRAVGNANGRNPLCIVTPCHRVIAADGSWGGYSEGLDKKQFLLNLERIS